MMNEKQIADTLHAAGCKSSESDCAHRAFHGEEVKPGTPQKGRIFCSRYYSQEGILLSVPRKDPRHDGQYNHDHLFTERLAGGVTTGALTEVQKLELELEATKTAKAEKIRADVEKARAEELRRQIAAEREGGAARGASVPTYG